MYLFPDLTHAAHGQVNLDTEAQAYARTQGWTMRQANRFLDPDVCQELVDHVHLRERLAFSYGGWMELRRFLWRGSYLDDTGAFTHLGVDFMVPAGTRVAACVPAVVIRVDCDTPAEGGWGTRIILRAGNDIQIYAHLARDADCVAGDELLSGDVFARVGTPDVNGGWFPHLHVQRVLPDLYDRLAFNDLRDLDGYGLGRSHRALRRLFPNPMDVLTLHSSPAPVL